MGHSVHNELILFSLGDGETHLEQRTNNLGDSADTKKKLIGLQDDVDKGENVNAMGCLKWQRRAGPTAISQHSYESAIQGVSCHTKEKRTLAVIMALLVALTRVCHVGDTREERQLPSSGNNSLCSRTQTTFHCY
jgi:hypothetical protein